MRRHAWLIRYHLCREVALHLKEDGCFDSCSTRRALFCPIYSRGEGGEQAGREVRSGFHHVFKETFFPCCLAMQTDEVEGVTLSKNGQVGAIKLAAEI